MPCHAVLRHKSCGIGIGIFVKQTVVAYAKTDNHIQLCTRLIQQTGLQNRITHRRSDAFTLLRYAHRRFRLAAGLADNGKHFKAVVAKDAGKNPRLVLQPNAVGYTNTVVTHFPGESHDFLHTGQPTVAFVFHLGRSHHHPMVLAFVITLHRPLPVGFVESRSLTEFRVCAVLIFAILRAAIHATQFFFHNFNLLDEPIFNVFYYVSITIPPFDEDKFTEMQYFYILKGHRMTPQQQERYKRHILLPEIGEAGQQRLLDSRVLIVGAGGLGSPVALYLAAAGVGHLGIADFDTVDLSNLQRQIIHTTHDIGRPKTLSAQEKIAALNPDVKVTAIPSRFDSGNAAAMIADYDIVVDATDSLDIKYLINDTCVKAGKPFVHGAINQYTGNVMTVLPGTACYRCVFPQAQTLKPSSEYGVFGAIAGIAGTLQAAEVIKYLTGTGELLTNRLLSFDARTMQFFVLDTAPSPACPNHR